MIDLLIFSPHSSFVDVHEGLWIWDIYLAPGAVCEYAALHSLAEVRFHALRSKL